jgi:hypothetical protein
LDGLLDRQINITKGIRGQASASQQHLRDFFATERTRDVTFPRVLSSADGDFLGGSFARHTKIWPLDDIDVYIPLDGEYLFYLRWGQRLPYTVLADGILCSNPLLLSRWTQFQYVSSARLIHEFANVLRRHYPTETQVSPNGESVSVRLKYGQTEDAEGLGYDIVPCFSLKPDDPNEIPFYLMPDGNNGWIRTNPRVDIEVAGVLHSFHRHLYRRVVKLVKYWNMIRVDGAFASYYIELALAKHFLHLRTQNAPIATLCEGLAVAFDVLQWTYMAGNQPSWITGAPPVEAPALDTSQIARFNLAVFTGKLARSYETAGDHAAAIRELSDLFGESL